MIKLKVKEILKNNESLGFVVNYRTKNTSSYEHYVAIEKLVLEILENEEDTKIQDIFETIEKNIKETQENL